MFGNFLRWVQTGFNRKDWAEKLNESIEEGILQDGWNKVAVELAKNLIAGAQVSRLNTTVRVENQGEVIVNVILDKVDK